MKMKLLLIVLFFFSCENRNEHSKNVHKHRSIQNDRVSLNLKGKVKQLIETTYQQVNESSGKMNEYQSDEVAYYFNEQGNFSKIIYYTDYGSLDNVWLYTYDSLGMKLYANILNSFNKIQKKVKYKYDQNGHIIEEYQYNAHDLLEFKRVHEYDFYGNNVKDVVYDSDGKIYLKTIYEFNDSGLESAIKNYSANGVLENNSEFLYDKSLLLSETKYYYHQSLSCVTISKHENFDEFQNWLQLRTFVNNKPDMRILRKIEYY